MGLRLRGARLRLAYNAVGGVAFRFGQRRRHPEWYLAARWLACVCSCQCHGALENQPARGASKPANNTRTSSNLYTPSACLISSIGHPNPLTQREGRGCAHDRCWRGANTIASRYAGCPREYPRGSGGPPPSPLIAGGLGQQCPVPCGANPAGSGRPIHKMPPYALHAAPCADSSPSSGDRSWPGDDASGAFSVASDLPPCLRSR